MNNFFISVCPLKVGDRFYRKVPSHLRSFSLPDIIIAEEITEMQDDEGIFYAIKGRFLYHTIGTEYKTYSSRIFESGDWVIEKKGEDFYGM